MFSHHSVLDAVSSPAYSVTTHVASHPNGQYLICCNYSDLVNVKRVPSTCASAPHNLATRVPKKEEIKRRVTVTSVHSNCHSRNILGHILLASPQRSAASTLASYNFPDAHLRLPSTQPCHHKILISVTPKEPRETPGLGWPPSHLVHAACSVCPAIRTGQAVSTAVLALDEERGWELLWWIVLKLQENSGSAETSAAWSPSSL